MLQKLRRKFIMVNMALVSLILLVVFGAFCISSYQNLKNDSMSALHRVIGRKGDMPPPKLELGYKPKKEHFFMLPIFFVAVSADGSLEIVGEENVDVSLDLAKEAVRLAMLDDKKEGIIKTLELRYLKEEKPNGIKIAFAQRTNEMQSMVRIVFVAVILLSGGLIAFFIVSLYLSRWALRPVEEAWAQQRQFVADASHELKTPVTVIMANTGILLAHVDEKIADHRKWVEYTQAEAIRMKKLVDDMLFLAKNDDAQPSKQFLQEDFSYIVLSSFLLFESVAFEQGISLDSDIDSDISIMGDKAQLQQLVVILLDNACKYVETKGKVFVSLHKTQEKIRLCVNNSGQAISQEDLKKIFERFYRADKSRARAAGGVGLGLAIAKRIVECHKGRIEVESTQKSGTTFTVTLNG